MKVIDLLNKIANGEEVPKKFKWCDDEWVYNNSASKNYFNDNNCEDLFTVIDGSALNDEVEIIEEDKEIENIHFSVYDYQRADDYLKKIEVKFNELIDEVNRLKNKEK